ncbi:MAG: type secretion protein [Tardiphaga sp.]|uniref:type VI secretion system membrane subunit TssM n=1 Tax=Tardiphaga sp. TaxID=1926292 RepID=UPI0026200757|nr:type VI secretion system membrane subunit TssM [Tardiphaga sp.]MDB5504010.1 type secretion protein [Tardiphaga sp.]
MINVSGKEIFRIVLFGVGLGSIAALIYLVGPLISIGGHRPLETYIGRQIAIVVVTALVAAVMTLQWRRKKKATARIAEGMAAADQPEDDTPVLKDKMKDALATLRTASGGKRDYLYELPWYVLIGPPGSGKTTALVNSGLKFPLSGGATPAAIAGVGGTRYCDWWFTEDAVLIDTAGRYTTQDSNAKADKQSWIGFLDLLKKNRPRQPINGVMVAVSLEDLMTLPPAEIAAHADAIRSRLLELHDRLKVDFPVYAVFTKSDLVAGFMEYFAGLNDQGRRQVWGATFQTDDKTRNLVGEVPAEFDALVERLNYDLTDRLQDEPIPSSRVLLYGFPPQVAGLKRQVFDFLNQIFEPTRYHANATLRGFYFTSGTQQGTPFDRLIGALAKSFGAEQVGAQAYSGRGKSYFLADLILRVIIGEAAWVSTDRAAVRRMRIMKTLVYGAIALVTIAAAGGWWESYRRNRDLIASAQTAVVQYAQQAGPFATEKTIGDRDFHRVMPLLHKLRTLPAGFSTHDTPTPIMATLGLSQRERLQASAVQIYHVGLERLFRPRLMFRLEEVLDANKANPGFTYEALKVYLMVAGVERADRELVVSWMRNDWSENLYQGASNAEGRKALEGELVSMFDLEDGEAPLVEPNWALVEECRRILARLNIADRAYQLLKSQARQAIAPDWIAARHGGPDFATVFESANGDNVEGILVPGFFTYAGFQRAFIDKLPTIVDQLQRDNWVLGDAGKIVAITSQFDRLTVDLLALYGKEFSAAWKQSLEKLRMRPLNVGKPRYDALNAAAASTSPIRLLLESIRDETALTRERKDTKAATDKAGDAKAPAPALLGMQAGSGVPGATIEAEFKPYHQVVEGEGGRRQIDTIIGDLTQINTTLQTVAMNSSQEQQTTGAIRAQIAQFKTDALRMPPPFNTMLLQAANAFENTVADDTYRQIRDEFQKSIFGPCQGLAAGRYPMDRAARSEIGLADFGRLFGGNGYFDTFFKKYLEAYADTSQRDWKWRQDNPVAKLMSVEAIRQFQRAARIKDAFFPTNGNVPMVSLNVTPPVLPDMGLVAKLEVNGIAVASSSQPNPPPVAVQWPGAGGRTAVSLVQDPPLPGAQPSEIPGGTGQWAFFRLLDKASKTPKANGITASWIVGGREVPFQIGTGTVFNPLQLPALAEFKCPTSL